MNDILLLSLPYATVEKPLYGVSLLKSALSEYGMQSEALYLNLEFADKIGLKDYNLITLYGDSIIGEWTFAKKAFPEFSPSVDDFLKIAADKYIGKKRLIYNFKVDDLYHILSRLRTQAGEFIDYAAEKLLNLNPRIIAAGAMFQQMTPSIALFKKIKEKSPLITTILGGSQCEGIMGLTAVKNFDCIDYAVSGEAENAFPELCRMILDNRANANKTLPEGVFVKDSTFNSKNISDAPRIIINNLDSTPYPDYGDYFKTLEKSSFKNKIKSSLLLETARGCLRFDNSLCRFCAETGKTNNYRIKSGNRIINEIKYLTDKYQIYNFHIIDNTLNPTFVKNDLPKIIELDDRIKTAYLCRAILSKNILRQMSECGVSFIMAGIESFHNSALKLINKSIDVFDNIQLLKFSRFFGINVDYNLLFNMPGENEDWYAETAEYLPLFFHFQPPHKLIPIIYQRFSYYFKNQAEYNLKFKPIKAYEYIYPLNKNDLYNIAFNFTDENSIVRRKLLLKSKFDSPFKLFCNIIKKWTELWNKKNEYLPYIENKPDLIMSDSNGEMKITDTRDPENCKIFLVSEIERIIILESESGITIDNMTRIIEEKYNIRLSQSEFQRHINQLKLNKLIFTLDNKIISLPIFNQLREYRPLSEFPGGYYNY
ncbi:MAG TPA: RiPP maturation radical SAM C-methyltransferase [bacterium]|nr:RiPP maturation radical SAM C-methyltransferase [bacterium]